MQQHDHLFEKICAWDNLLLAFHKAEKGKRDKPNVVAFRFRLAENLLTLKAELESGIYQPGPYTTFDIFEPKQRMISAAPFRDRVVHHALCNVIEPLFERSLVHDTYANRKGKGTHAAIRRCQAMMRKYPWALKCDIKKYFPSIDHALLKGMVARKIKCAATLRLVFQIIDHSNPQEAVHDLFPGDDMTPLPVGEGSGVGLRRRGLPMGNLTSQFLANCYLSPLDHFVQERLGAPGYVRYVDDFVVFGRSKQELQAVKAAIADFLAQHRLVLHPRKCHISPTGAGISFLGQRVFTAHRVLRSENVRRFWARLRQRLALYFKGRMEPDTVEAQLNSWLGHARQADTFRLRQRVLRYLWFDVGLVVCRAPEGEGWRVLERAKR